MRINPRRLIPIGVIAVLAVGGIALDRQREAKRSTLSGVFEAQPTRVSSRLGGRVAKILVKEGDAVKKGQKIIVFEADAATHETEAAAALAREAGAKSAMTKHGPRVEDIHRQEAVVRELSANLQRLKNGSRPEEVGIARQQVVEARARYTEVVRGPRREDVRAAREAEQEAYYRLKQAERGLTAEERAQGKARYEAAKADADAARQDADRERRLLDQGATSQRSWESAESRARQAEARLQDATEALKRTQLGTPPEELEQVRHAYERAHAQSLALQNGSRPEDVVAAKAILAAAQDNLRLVEKGPRAEDVQAAAARLQQATAALAALKNGSRPEEIAGSKAAAEAASHQAKSAKSNLDEMTVVAPIDGVVERILVSEGDLVAPGQSVVQMNDPSDIWLRVYLPESALAKVKTGDTAELLVDGVSDSVAAVVESLSTQGEFTPANLQTPEERGNQVFAVRLRLAKPDARVKAGMAASVKRMGAWP